MRRRTMLFACVLGACALWISTAVAGTLTLRYSDPDWKDIRAALDQYERDNPGTKVALDRVSPADVMPQFLRETAVGTGPDVVQVGFVQVKDLATAQAVLPLDDFTKPQKATQALADYVALDLATWKDGKVYALPWTTDTFAMVYRTDLMQKAGITAIPKTWDEFRDAAKKVHDATGKVGFQFPFGSANGNGIWFAANYWWWTHGQALIVKKPDGSYGLGVTAADVADDMRYFDSLLKAGVTPKAMISVSNWADPVIIEPLVSGDAMSTLVPPANFKQILVEWKERNPNGSDPPFISALVPEATAPSVTHAGGRSLVINANTPDPKGAWKLVQFLSSKKMFSDYYKTQMPAQKTLLKEIDFGPLLQGYAEQLQRARSWGPYAEGPVPIPMMWNETARDFGSVFVGESTPDQAAQTLLAAISKNLK
ncbi:MAG TPA: extracellular solute-binding protein [Acetobacteraceae bacterium]|jgi:multiple sugar transport system substrate-binding protein|nr:extracellular solute-binding protein [Acetobacteraceae bacterium]